MWPVHRCELCQRHPSRCPSCVPKHTGPTNGGHPATYFCTKRQHEWTLCLVPCSSRPNFFFSTGLLFLSRRSDANLLRLSFGRTADGILSIQRASLVQLSHLTLAISWPIQLLDDEELTASHTASFPQLRNGKRREKRRPRTRATEMSRTRRRPKQEYNASTPIPLSRTTSKTQPLECRKTSLASVLKHSGVPVQFWGWCPLVLGSVARQIWGWSPGHVFCRPLIRPR